MLAVESWMRATENKRSRLTEGASVDDHFPLEEEGVDAVCLQSGDFVEALQHDYRRLGDEAVPVPTKHWCLPELGHFAEMIATRGVTVADGSEEEIFGGRAGEARRRWEGQTRRGEYGALGLRARGVGREDVQNQLAQMTAGIGS
jgi:hypothetical protein